MTSLNRAYILIHNDYADTAIQFVTTIEGIALCKLKTDYKYCDLEVWEEDTKIAEIYFNPKTNGNQPWMQRGWHIRGKTTEVAQRILGRLNEGDEK